MKATVIDEAAAGVIGLAFSADGHTLVVGDDAGNVRVWALDGAAAKVVCDFQVELPTLHGLAVDPTGRSVVVVGVGGGAIHDRRGAKRADIALEGGAELQSVAIAPSGRILVAGDDERVRVVGASDGAGLRCGERNAGIVLAPDGQGFVVAAARQGGSRVVRGAIDARGALSATGAPIDLRVDALSSPAFSADGARLLVPARELRLYDAAASRLVAAWDHAGERCAPDAAAPVLLEAAWSQAVRLAPDLLACATPADGRVFLVDPSAARVVDALPGHAGGTTALAAHGALLASAGLDHALRLWRA